MKSDPDRRNILFLSRETSQYGAERQLRYLLEGLTKERYRPIVAFAEPTVKNSVTEDAACGYLRMRPWRKAGNLFTRYIDAFRLLKLARTENVSLIHCSYQWLFPYARFVGRRLNIPVVLHIRRPNNPPKKLRRLKYGDCDTLIPISARIRRELISAEIPEHKIVLIPDAVDLSSFDGRNTRLLREELGLGEQVIFGMVARVNRHKRQLDFVHAARKLLDRGHDAVFVIAGRFEDMDYREEIAEFIAANGLGSRFFLLGHRDDAASVIASLDVLVSLSGGSVMYEGMASGRTVISAGFTKPENATNLVDGVNGLVTDSRDCGVLADLMERVLDHDLRDKLGAAAQQWAQAHFSTEALVAATERVYEELISSRARGNHA